MYLWREEPNQQRQANEQVNPVHQEFGFGTAAARRASGLI
jgi:hypothetical protein